MSNNAQGKPGEGYMKWFNRLPLRQINSKEENEVALSVALELMRIGQHNLKKDEIEYLCVLSILIEEFEDRTYDLGPDLTPEEMLEELMKEYGLTQKDLIPEMGSQAAVSYVLNGKRRLTMDQISALAKRFRISPEVFLPKYAPRPKELVKTAARKSAVGQSSRKTATKKKKINGKTSSRSARK